MIAPTWEPASPKPWRRRVSVLDCDESGAASASPTSAFANPKSRIVTLPSGPDLDIRRFQVPVNDRFVVRGLEAIGNLHEQRNGFVDRDGASRDALGQSLALNELHDQELAAFVLLQAVQGRDIRVIELSQDPGLSLEPSQAFLVLGELLRQDLDRHIPAELSVSGPVNLSHPAFADGLEDLVVG